MKTRLKNNPMPIQIEGLPYIVAGLLLLVSSFILWRASLLSISPEFIGEDTLTPPTWGSAVATVFFTLFTLFSVWFYRNPNRPTPQNEPESVFSPADGRVLKIETVDGSRIGLPNAKKISIFMSPFDVHVNRSPLAGKIESIHYTKGKFFKADLDKASEENEHSWYVLKDSRDHRIAFVQIAGFVARRIVTYISPGENLVAGERFGMIRFGSRMEILLPMHSEVVVKPGEKTLAGLTRLAKLK